MLRIVPVLLLLMLACTTAASASDWAPADFTGTTRAYIHGAATDLTEYQVKFVLYNVTGTDSSEHIHLPGIVQPSFNDVRFALSDGTSLSYWMETPTGSDNAIFWVKMPSIPAEYDNTVAVDIYYGNPTIGSAADGDATFTLFDDFSGSSLDTDKWTVVSGTGYSVSNSRLNMSSTTKIQSNVKFNQDASLRFHANLKGYQQNAGFRDSSNTSYYTTLNVNLASGLERLYCTVNSVDLGGSTGYYWSIDEYRTPELSWNSTYISFSDGVNPLYVRQAALSATLPTYLASQSGTSRTGYYDWVFVRQLADSEPSVNEPPGTEATIDLAVAGVSTSLLPRTANTVTATIANLGTDDAGAFKANFTLNGTTTTFDITGLSAQNTTTISVTDPITSRKLGDTVPLTIELDTDNVNIETNKTNNTYVGTATVSRAPGTAAWWNGGRYYTGYDLETGVYQEGNISLLYSTGDSGYQTGGGWYSTTVHWTNSDLPIPANAKIKSAKLYQSYTWSNNGNPGFTVQFNGHTVNQAAFYTDGPTTGILEYNGQAIYDVAPFFETTGNNAVVSASQPSGGLYGTVLVVVYEDTNEPYRKIWLDEGCDCLLYEGVGYAMFHNVTTTGVSSAKVTTILPSGGDNNQGSIFYNSQPALLKGTGGGDPGYKYYEVTDHLIDGTNELGVAERGEGYLNLAAAILELTYEAPPSGVTFKTNVTSGTAPVTVQFTDLSYGTTGWQWDFDNNGVVDSTDQNPIHTYTVAGTYAVNLTATNAYGSANETKTAYITVSVPAVTSGPAVAFSATPTSGTWPVAVQFSDESTGGATAWLWDFGDYSTSSTEQNPAHTYTQAGTYNVTLSATNGEGTNTTVKQNIITVNPVTDTRLLLTNEKSGTVSGDLYVGAFQPVPWDDQPQPGTVTSRDVDQAFSIPAFTGIQWARLYVNIYSGSGGANWPSRTITSLDANGDGTYETVLGVENMSMSTYSQDGKAYWLNNHTFRVYSDYETWYDVTDLISSQTPAVHIRNEMSGGDKYQYDGRIKTVTLVVAYNDGDSDQVRYFVNHGGDWFKTGSSFTTFSTAGMPSGFTGATLSNVALSSNDGTYTFNSVSLPNASPVSPLGFFENHTWSVTDKVSTSSDSVFSYTYVKESFKTTLATLAISYPGTPAVTPVAAFSGTPVSGTAPLTVTFTDASTNSPATWSWDFGDGNTTNATRQNPVHTYLTSGTYSVNLTVNNTAGSDFENKTAYITVTSSGGGAPPVAGFLTNTTTGTVPLTVQFTNTSTTAPTAWAWDFDNDGTVDSTDENPTHTFSSAGTYTVKLTVTNGSGTASVVKKNSIGVSAGPDRLQTVKSGTVSGDLYVGAQGAWSTTNSKVVNTFEPAFTLPSYTDIQWARLYTVVYGSNADNREGTAVVSFDGDGNGVYETVLGTETLAVPSDSTANVYPVSNNVTKQYLNYQIQYDVTGLISSTSPKAKVVVTPVAADFDGRINEVTLVVAYNDGDSDVVKYWVNDGFDFQTSSAGAVTTTFATGSLSGTPSSATLKNVHVSSQDAIYTFNGNSLARQGNNLLSFATNSWEVKDYVTAGSDSSFTYQHNTSSSFKTTLATLTVKSTTGGTPSTPVAAFSASATTGTAPFTVIFTDSSTNTPTGWLWDFGDGNTTNSTVRNPVHTYLSSGTYFVNLTVNNTAGSDFENKTGYITVSSSAPGAVDLQVVNVTTNFDYFFAHEPNTINTTIRNAGSVDAGEFQVTINVNGTPAVVTVPALGAGSETMLMITDPSLLVAGNTTTITVTADSTGKFTEANEADNIASITSAVTNNGYKGMRYTDGSDIVTRKLMVVNGDILWSVGNSTYQGGKQNPSYTVGWTAADLSVPDGANVTDARLYATYTWDEYDRMHSSTMTFNGQPVSPLAHYSDVKNWGTWAYPYGMIIYDVTSLFSPDGNQAYLAGPNKICPMRGMMLVVTYKKPDESEKQIFLNDGFDLLYASPTKYATTEEEATAYAPFTGATIDTANVRNATLTMIVNRGGGGQRGAMIFNGHAWPDYWSRSSAAEIAVTTTDVKEYLAATGNTALFQSQIKDDMDMEPHIAILKIEYKPTAPTATFTANTTNGTVPLTVKFTDQSTGIPTSWAWDFNNDGTIDNTNQSPTHTFELPDTYTVSLTATNDLGSNKTVKNNYITVTKGKPVAAFTANKTAGDTPLVVQFTDQSTGLPDSWAWDFGDGDTSAGQNPLHTYAGAGTYTVKLTVRNSEDTDTETKSGFISVNAKKVVDTAFNLTGVQTAATDSGQNVSIDTTQLTVETNSTTNTVTITSPGNGWASLGLVMNDTIETSGTTINGTVSSVKAVGDEITVPIPAVGSPKIHVELALDKLPDATQGITQTITKDPDTNASSSFTIAASGEGKDLNIGYTVNFEKNGNLDNCDCGGIIRNATVYFDINSTWVADHGGVSKIVIMRKPDTGDATFLAVTHRGSDGIGNESFSALSPNGLSTFIIASWSPVVTTTAPTPTPTATTSTSTSSSGTDSSSGSGSLGGTGSVSKGDVQKGKVYDYSLMAPIQSTGTYQTTAVSSKGRVSITPMTAERSASMPEAKAKWSAEIVSDPDGGGRISTSLATEIPASAISSFNTALSPRSLEIASVAYAMNVDEDDRIGATKDGVIEMTAPQEWVSENGGVNQVKIFRIGNDGNAGLLSTAFSGYDHETGYLTFRAESPDGLCTFILLAVKPVSGTAAASPSGTGLGVPAGTAPGEASQGPASQPAPGPDIGTIVAGVLVIAGCAGLVHVYRGRKRYEK